MKRTLARIVSLALCLGLLSACGGGQGSGGGGTQQPSEGGTTVENNKPLVVGYAPFNGKFSPFFSETAYDQDVWAITAANLLDNDRQGGMILKGIEGETRSYNGTDYTYKSLADCEIVENPDGTVDYNFTIRDDVKFADGTPMTIDDAIFSFYVLCDPTYDGNSTLYAIPIVGIDEYRAGMTTLSKALPAAGRDNTDFSAWTEAQQTKFWENFDKPGGLCPVHPGLYRGQRPCHG